MLDPDLIKPKASWTGGPIWRPWAKLGRAGIFVVLLPWAAKACEAPMPAVKNIALPRFYADKAGTEIDPEMKAAHASAVEPLKDFVAHVTADADKAWTRAKLDGQVEAGRCAISWMAAWAAQGALLGRMETKQAEYQRKWDQAGLALAYLKVRRFASPSERATIEPWLIHVADAARAFFNDPGHKRNNHWYWLGLGLGATALATGSEPHWLMAKGIFADAMRDIGADGAIAHEMARHSRALHYHDFAVMPLVVLAELAASRGEDWYAGQGAALHRLVALTLAGHADPAVFDRLASIAQERPVRPPAGWLSIYRARFPQKVAGRVVTSKPGHRWLGGNASVLAAALKPR